MLQDAEYGGADEKKANKKASRKARRNAKKKAKRDLRSRGETVEVIDGGGEAPLSDHQYAAMLQDAEGGGKKMAKKNPRSRGGGNDDRVVAAAAQTSAPNLLP